MKLKADYDNTLQFTKKIVKCVRTVALACLLLSRLDWADTLSTRF
jgi:hypothetical protein